MSIYQYILLSFALCVAGCGKASDSRGIGANSTSSPGTRIQSGGHTEVQGASSVATAKDSAPALERVDIGDAKTLWMLPLRHKNLTLLPVTIEPSQVDTTDYLTLDEGMKEKLVKVSEVSEDGDVNNLRIKNKSAKPLFLLAGEVIIGGKQDRIIGKTLVVQAGERTTVPVFCVEQGRWNGRKADFSSAESIAHLKLRSVANYGSQGGVWSEVAKKNKERGESNGTDTYRGVATKKGAVSDYKTAIEAAYAKHLGTHAVGGEPLVGFAIAYNGDIVGIESFQSPSLLGKLRSKLMHSYYVDALDRVYDETRSARPIEEEARSKGGVYKGRKAGRKMLGSGLYNSSGSQTSSWKSGKIRSTEVRVKGKKGKRHRPEDAAEEEADQEAALYDSVQLD